MTFVLTLIALIAFAANSILCRLALGSASIDAIGFTTLRLVSGAFALWILIGFSRRKWGVGGYGSWTSAFALFVYAAAFSFAYASLSAGTGALILFGSVQITMLSTGLFKGERLRVFQWLGLVMAFTGFVLLVSPGLKAPAPLGSALMTSAGIAWGAYSLRGRNVTDPIAVTADNFARSIAFLFPLLGIELLRGLHITPVGALWAILSGALTSGLGYVFWYAALRGMKVTTGAIAQLSVPILAAGGGILLLGETPTLRFLLSTISTLGGMGLVVAARKKLIVVGVPEE